MGKEIDTQVQEAQKVANRVKPKKSTPRHIITKMAKIKDEERILKAAREKKLVMYKGTPIRKSINELCIRNSAGQREWHNIFKVIKRKKPATKNTLPSKIIIQI